MTYGREQQLLNINIIRAKDLDVSVMLITTKLSIYFFIILKLEVGTPSKFNCWSL